MKTYPFLDFDFTTVKENGKEFHVAKIATTLRLWDGRVGYYLFQVIKDYKGEDQRIIKILVKEFIYDIEMHRLYHRYNPQTDVIDSDQRSEVERLPILNQHYDNKI